MQGEKEGMRVVKSTFPIHSICYTTHLPVAPTCMQPLVRRGGGTPTCMQPLVRRGGGIPSGCNHLPVGRHPEVQILRESINAASKSELIRRWTMDERLPQSALEFCPIHCPNGRLGQDLGFGGSAFALKLPELLNRNLVAVRAKL